ncbi:hypothetical protein ACFOOJ_15720, partial [Sphingobium xenophagum]
EETRLTCHHRLLRIADEVNQIRRSNARVFRGVQLTCHHRLLRIADEVNQIRRSNARVFRGVQLCRANPIGHDQVQGDRNQRGSGHARRSLARNRAGSGIARQW